MRQELFKEKLKKHLLKIWVFFFKNTSKKKIVSP